VVRRIDEYIAAHIRRPLSTRDIARALGYNADYLSRVYRAGSGRTLTEGIHARRIADARLALTQTTQTVDQIAYACGYGDPSYFRRMFHRLTGSTPKAFRDMYYRVKINTR
jgi:AraC-like DNA-binding protein